MSLGGIAYGNEGLGSLEEGSELPASPPGRCPLRPLQVHVSPSGARRLSLGPGADPRLGHLRPVHTSPLSRPNWLRFNPDHSRFGRPSANRMRAKRPVSQTQPALVRATQSRGANGLPPYCPGARTFALPGPLIAGRYQLVAATATTAAVHDGEDDNHHSSKRGSDPKGSAREWHPKPSFTRE